MTKNNKLINYGNSLKDLSKLLGTKTSVQINGFWFHISWDGENGTDQHGRKWRNRKQPTCDNIELIKKITGETKQAVEDLKAGKLL